MSDIIERLIFVGAEPDVLEAADRSLETGSILSTDICPVLDTEGNPLVVGQIYLNSGIKIKVRSWVFGCGNIIERYYRVFYTDENLRDTFLVVKAKYSRGLFGGAVYRSSLSLVKVESTESTTK